MALSGTLKKVTIDGITYRVSGEIDVNITPGTTNEMQPTSGKGMKKVTKKNATIEGVTLVCDGAEHENLKLAQDANENKMSITMADGDVYSAPGCINLEGYQSATRVATISLMPFLDWKAFLA